MRPPTLATATLAALAFAGPAAAHTPAVSVACEIPAGGGPGVPTATYSYRDFGATLVTATETTTADGAATTGTYTFTRSGQHVVTLTPRYGRFLLSGATSSVQDGRTWRASASGEVDCGAAPVPMVPVMPELSPPLPPPNNIDITPAPPVLTPGAPEPMPRKKATPRPRPKPTCKALLRARAGKWSYVRLGYYPFCVVPRPRILKRIAVTG